MIIINASILTFNILTFFCILLFLLVFVTSLCLGFLNFEIDTVTVVNTHETVCRKDRVDQGGFDGRGQPTASPMLTAIMSGGVGISGRELYKYR